jgi:hypothetical protein
MTTGELRFVLSWLQNRIARSDLELADPKALTRRSIARVLEHYPGGTPERLNALSGSGSENPGRAGRGEHRAPRPAISGAGADAAADIGEGHGVLGRSAIGGTVVMMTG